MINKYQSSEIRHGLKQHGDTVVAKIISVHSFRGGTGKSNATANVAAVLASLGQRVGVIDTDIQSPGIHILFGLSGDEITRSLNDFLWHGQEIKSIAQDVTPNLGAQVSGKVLTTRQAFKAVGVLVGALVIPKPMFFAVGQNNKWGAQIFSIAARLFFRIVGVFVLAFGFERGARILPHVCIGRYEHQ